MANVYKPLVDSYLTRFGDWQREPGAPALPLPDQTIESLYLPESALDAESSDPGF